MSAPIRCCDGCGATVADDAAAGREGWQRLQITGRMRCAKCTRALAAINRAAPEVGIGGEDGKEPSHG